MLRPYVSYFQNGLKKELKSTRVLEASLILTRFKLASTRCHYDFTLREIKINELVRTPTPLFFLCKRNFLSNSRCHRALHGYDTITFDHFDFTNSYKK